MTTGQILPRLSEGVIRSEDPDGRVTLLDVGTNRCLRFGPRARLVLDRLDGRTSVDELVAIARAQFDRGDAGVQAALTGLLDQLGRSGFLEGRPAEPAGASSAQHKEGSIMIPWRAKPLRSRSERWSATVWRVSVLAAVAAATLASASLWSARHEIGASQPLWPAVVGLLIIHTAFHEWGHVVAAKLTGLPVLGIKIHFFARVVPIPSIVTTNVLALARRRDRVLVSLMGPLVDIGTTALVASLAPLAPAGSSLRQTLLAVAFIQALVVLYLLVPAAQSDGGRILAHLIGRPTLTRDALRARRSDGASGRLIAYRAFSTVAPTVLGGSIGWVVWQTWF